MLIDQETTSLGKMMVYYAPQAIRLDIDRIKSSLIMKAPDWKVHLFQTAKHLIFEIDADKFEGQVDGARYAAIVSPPRLDIEVQYKNLELFSGLKAKRFIYSPDKEQMKRTCLRSAQYWLSELPISTKAAHVIDKIYNVPLQAGLPLGFYVVTYNHYDTKELFTRHTAPRQFDAKTFAIPTGFRSCSSVFEFWNAAIGADENRDNLLEFFQPGAKSK